MRTLSLICPSKFLSVIWRVRALFVFCDIIIFRYQVCLDLEQIISIEQRQLSNRKTTERQYICLQIKPIHDQMSFINSAIVLCAIILLVYDRYMCIYLDEYKGRLRGLAVACRNTDHYHPCSNPGVGISEGCFVFHFVSLPLEVARPI